MTPLLNGLGAIADNYDAFLIDVWGVLHDGGALYPGVLDCLEHLDAVKKPVVFISNAPRPAQCIVTRLTELGCPPVLYNAVMTAGEDVRQELLTLNDPWYAALDKNVYILGPEKDAPLIAETGFYRVMTPRDANFLIATGLKEGGATQDYAYLMREARAKKLPMICANPDKIVIHNGFREICAGALAEEYEALGGSVRYHGKPYPSIYAACFALLNTAAGQTIPLTRILAIGDGLETDIQGAKNAGISSLFISGGIHEEALHPNKTPLDAAQLDALVASLGLSPIGVMQRLAW